MHNNLDRATPTGSDPRPGDIVMLFRLDENSTASPLCAQYAILALLRQAGFIPDDEADQAVDAMDIAEFTQRGRLQQPIVRRYGRLEGWH
ncbi:MULTISPECIES: hypothetical protein [unclassified Nocardia]|uniref:hypothetical protein n=1 Tax=unclassified Nocardia TaxID=2637762 RepID=UPI00278C76DB|nr:MULTISPECIES: hypothetical protein [unclassified Nocardia]